MEKFKIRIEHVLTSLKQLANIIIILLDLDIYTIKYYKHIL